MLYSRAIFHLWTSDEGRFNAPGPTAAAAVDDDDDKVACFGFVDISFTSFLNVVATPSRTA
jgi:hypothetical protein